MKIQIKVDTCLHRGAIHENHNEDALFHSVIEEKWLIAAVMDGCSTGTDNHFTSHLYKKLIHKACKTIPFVDKLDPGFDLDSMNVSRLGKYILEQVFHDFVKYTKLLLLDKSENLATLLLAVYSIPLKELWVNVSGDGYLCVNDQIRVFDQHNVPDFMGYHIKNKYSEWHQEHSVTIIENNIDSFCLATDGITKFFNAGEKELKMIDHSKTYLLKSTFTPEEQFRTHKLSYQHPYDDIAIIKVNTD